VDSTNTDSKKRQSHPKAKEKVVGANCREIFRDWKCNVSPKSEERTNYRNHEKGSNLDLSVLGLGGGLVSHSDAVRLKTWVLNLVWWNYSQTGFELVLEACGFRALL
jgi:hypothetical protein